MMDIFNWFGSLLGYLLWFLYGIVRNYGVAIILFTLIVKVLVFPFSVKQQKSMASQAKVQKKVKELQKIYANDKMKLNEEVQKLYQKEGVSMSGGCLTMLIPYPILLGIYSCRSLSAAQRAAHQRERRQRGDAAARSDPRPGHVGLLAEPRDRDHQAFFVSARVSHHVLRRRYFED